MRASPYLVAFLTLLFSGAAPRPAAAAQVNVDLDRVEVGPVTATGVSAVLLLRDAGRAQLRLFAARLELPGATALARLEVRCEEGVVDGGRVLCPDGVLSADHPVRGTVTGRMSFAYDGTVDAVHVSIAPIAVGDTVIEGTLQRTGEQWQAEFTGQKLALNAGAELLGALDVWPAEYADAEGTLDAAVRLRGEGRALTHAEGVIRVDSATFAGPNSAEDLSLETSFTLQLGDRRQVRAEGRISAGLLYLEPGIEIEGLRPGIVLEAGAEPIRFAVDAEWDAAARRLRVGRLDLVHPAVAEASFTADVQLGDPWAVHEADLVLTGAAAGPLYTTYLQPFLLGTRFNALETVGMLEATARIREGALHELNVDVHDVHAYDGNGRFSVAGLDGTLRVNPDTEPVTSMLRWAGMGIYRLGLGAGELGLSSAAGAVEVVSWVDVPILDGELRIGSLAVRDAGRPDMSIRMDGELTPISMADFTQALGWPVMSGRLTGRIDGLKWEHGRLEVGGSIEVGLFGGKVTVRDLSVENLFGLLPVLRADIDINDIDLAQLTDRFSFGRIEGKLGGKIHDLELQAWQPVYFDAELATPADDRSRHRISQRAVDNLGLIGGGASAALSGGFLRWFQEYSYGRLGIRCRLYNGACELGGVEETGDGFLILTRGGLLPPWIEVKGAGRSIGWHDLVEGLKRIASESPEIR